jgi:hypothetical protein
MIDNPHLILVDEATPDQLNSVHLKIKKAANGWWHHLPSAWIAGGDLSAGQWMDLLKDSISDGSASLVILALPNLAQDRDWAFFGGDSKKRAGWLHKTYAPE